MNSAILNPRLGLALRADFVLLLQLLLDLTQERSEPLACHHRVTGSLRWAERVERRMDPRRGTVWSRGLSTAACRLSQPPAASARCCHRVARAAGRLCSLARSPALHTLQGTATADALQAIADLDLDSITAIEGPAATAATDETQGAASCMLCLAGRRTTMPLTPDTRSASRSRFPPFPWSATGHTSSPDPAPMTILRDPSAHEGAAPRARSNVGGTRHPAALPAV